MEQSGIMLLANYKARSAIRTIPFKNTIMELSTKTFMNTH